jgi:hypothetical protein
MFFLFCLPSDAFLASFSGSHVNIGGVCSIIVLCPNNSSKEEAIMAKHLTFDNRLDIEKYIKENYSISNIARMLNRHKNAPF